MEAHGQVFNIPNPTDGEIFLFHAFDVLVLATLDLYEEIKVCEDCKKSESACCLEHEMIVDTLEAAGIAYKVLRECEAIAQQQETQQQMSPETREQ